MECAGRATPLTSVLYVLSIILQSELKQWLWKIPEVALDIKFRNSCVCKVEMADYEKFRNYMNVVCRAERK